MDAIDCPDWESFDTQIKGLRSEYAKATAPLVFRGQGGSEWKLETTLERSDTKARKMLFSSYYMLICGRLTPEVKTFAGIEIPDYESSWSRKTFSDRGLFQTPDKFPGGELYRYMAYLRHLGFPSPLLDWSRSPYVAAFFAFREPSTGVGKRSIYAYCDNPTGIRGGAVGEPFIHRIGPYVHTHHRHFRQRCDYTVCGAWDPTYEQWRFDSHEYVFAHRRPKQDYCWKFDLPSTEREGVLRILNDYNLNAFSLFGSEESLLESLWVREYMLREPLAG
jgi:hypothetical protein